MYLGVVVFDILIYETTSLKEKRMVLKRIKDRFFSRFKVQLNEVGYEEKWQRSRLAFSIISNKNFNVNDKIEKMTGFIHEHHEFELLDIYKDIEKREY